MKKQPKSHVSDTERDVLIELERKWNDKLQIIPQLPLNMLITVAKEDIIDMPNEFRDTTNETMSNGELIDAVLSSYNTTTVDFTICNESKVPLFSIEFDGFGKGFSRDDTYYSTYKKFIQRDDYENLCWTRNTKLRLCRDKEYPIIFISMTETDISKFPDQISILDVIIGKFMAKNKTTDYMDQASARDTVERLGLTDYNDVADIFEDEYFRAEGESERDWNPAAKAFSEMQLRLGTHLMREFRISHFPPWSWRFRLYTERPLQGPIWDNGCLPYQLDIGKAEQIIAGVTLLVGKNCIVEKFVEVRNFNCQSIDPVEICFDIAELLAFRKACKKYGVPRYLEREKE